MTSTIKGRATVQSYAFQPRLRPLVGHVRQALATGALIGATIAAPGVRAAQPIPELPVARTDFVGKGLVDAPTVSVRPNGGQLMNINQRSDKAILNWRSFDIANKNKVHFQQPSATSIALNRIDGNARPSQILGELSATGQVYLSNPNGFVFGKESRVNVSSLVATTHNISDEALESGITKVIDQNNTTPIAALTADGDPYMKDENGHYVLNAQGARIKRSVTLEDGAEVRTAKGGRILIAAPTVTNKGSLESEEGQIIVAAATDKVYLQEADSDSGVRGLLVEVETGGKVENIGKMVANRGNITLAGFAVNQSGRVSANTSVRLGGSIRLLAREGAALTQKEDKYILTPASTKRTTAKDDGLGTKATLTLGENSITEALPDVASTESAIDDQAQERSRIDLMGHTVHLKNNASVIAPSGVVKVVATDKPANPDLDNIQPTDARIHLDPGARIDVAGLKNVQVAMERNVVEVDVRSNELRDAPIQKSGPLFGSKISVDVRKGTKMADISGAVNRIERRIDERSTEGGQIELLSSGDVVVNKGATLDVSGGAVNYQAGTIKTSKLMNAQGSVDISDANPNLTYSKLDNSAPGRFEQGYVEGKDGGALKITTNRALLDGELKGGVTTGLYQRDAASRPAGSHFDLKLGFSPLSWQNVLFSNTKQYDLLDVASPFPKQAGGGANQSADLVLTGDFLQRGGIQHTTLTTNGRIDIQQGVTLSTPEFGSLSLKAAQLKVAGVLKSVSGAVNLSTSVSGDTPAGLDGSIVLAKTGRIDVSGRWVNDNPVLGATPNAPLAIAGGKVKLRADGDLELAGGSQIAADGGAWRASGGKIKAGKGGEIDLGVVLEGADMRLNGDLHAYALEENGSLSILANEVVVADKSRLPASGNGVVGIDTGLFAKGAFGSYTLASNLNGVTVRDDVRLKQTNRLLNADAYRQRSTDSILNVSQRYEQFDHLRNPTHLALLLRRSLQVAGRPGAAIRVEQGADIVADAGSRIGMDSDSSIFVGGTIKTPAGQIELSLHGPDDVIEPGYLPGQAIWLGSRAKLTTAGVTQLEPHRLGLRTGDVLDGGLIALNAERGFVVAEKGSEMDVSGTSAILDLPSTRGYAPALVGSKGGTVRVTAAEGAILDGALKGKAGHGKVAAGELSVELSTLQRSAGTLGGEDLPFPTTPRVIHVRQDEQPSLSSGVAFGQNMPADANGQAYVSASAFEGGGFGSLKLRTQDTVRFDGNVTLGAERRIVLDAPEIAWGNGNGDVVLNTGYLALGSTLYNSSASATGGGGNFTANAGWIDLVGNSLWKGFDEIALNSRDDLRMVGISPAFQPIPQGKFVTAANLLSIRADQIYPSTLTDYRVAIENNANGKLKITAGDGAKPVLSAAGKLTLDAPEIEQSGVVKAPFGEIVMNAGKKITLEAGSTTSVSAEGQLIPFGRITGDLAWIYPRGPQSLVYDNAPDKRITLDAASVALKDGAVVDLSGGGDLQAYEFIPGLGGSVDVLDPLDPNVVNGKFGWQEKYAILPKLAASFAPYDPLEFPSAGLAMGDSIYLSGGGGVAAGEYVLLPAHYALLPGAYLVTPEAGTRDALPGVPRNRADGAAVVAGYRTTTGTNDRDARWSGFAVERGEVALTRSELHIRRANDFLPKLAQQKGTAAPQIPNDAGQLTLAVDTNLILEGALRVGSGVNGRGSRVDIIADDLAVVNNRNENATRVELLAGSLQRLGADSLSLGGSRSRRGDSVEVTAKAKKVTVDEGVKLQGPEILLAATDEVKVGRNAELKGQGEAVPTAKNLKLKGDGAMVLVSALEQDVTLDVAAAGTSGDLLIDQGALLSSTGNMVLYGGGNVALKGELAMQGGNLALGASQLSLGEVPGNVGGLALDEQTLQALDVDKLTLLSSGQVNLWGDFRFATRDLTINAAGIAGAGAAGAHAVIETETFTLTHPTGVASTGLSGQGTLDVLADAIRLDQGDYAITGFADVNLTARGQLTGNGIARLRSDGNFTLTSGRIAGTHGSDLAIDASGHQAHLLASGRTPTGEVGLGAKFSLRADEIHHAGNILLPSGLVNLTANTGNVALETGSVIDVSGQELDFAGQKVYSSAGKVRLAAEKGSVTMADTAKIDLSGHERGGHAGRLTVAAGKGDVRLDGIIQAQAMAGYRGGDFIVDALSLGATGFDGWVTRVADSGFSGDLDLRLRSGDAVLSATKSIRANNVSLAVDQGKLEVAGRIDVHGAEAGDIKLSAGDNVRLTETAVLDAHSEGDGKSGGKVVLATVDQDGDSLGQVEILGSGAQKATIDLRGGPQGTANQAGQGGELRVRALRKDTDGNGQHDEVAVGAFQGNIQGASKVSVEAVKVENMTSIAKTNIDAWKTATTSFMANAPAIANRLGSGVEVLPGLEVRSAGDLTLGNAWDLLSWRYGVNGKSLPGVLTLRAGGNLNVNAGINDGFGAGTLSVTPVQNLTNKLQPGESWSYRLVAGADLAGSDVLATNSLGTGNVTLASGAVVRTGTGDIEVVAGGNIVLTDDDQTSSGYNYATGDKAAIYTAGRPDLTHHVDGAGVAYDSFYGAFKQNIVARNFYAEYPVDGGDIVLKAGGNIKGASTPQLISDWWVRTGDWDPNLAKVDERPVAWGIALDQPSLISNKTALRNIQNLKAGFKQNIGALGGGDVTIAAGGSIDDLSVMLPTTGKPMGKPASTNLIGNTNNAFTSNEILVQGGGNLRVGAGGDIKGGVFFVDKGTARLEADGSVIGGTQYTSGPLFAMGDTDFNVVARGDIQVGSVFNPGLIQPSYSADKKALFATYGDASGIAFTTAGGDIHIQNDTSAIQSQYQQWRLSGSTVSKNDIVTASWDVNALRLYPGTLAARALSGDINLIRSFTLFPKADGNLELLAGNTITTGTTGNAVEVNLSDADPTSLPSVSLPYATLVDVDKKLQIAGEAKLLHASVPVHQKDHNPVRVTAKAGDIWAQDPLLFGLAKKAEFSAGRDIQYIGLKVQHANAGDVTLMQAGRDITYSPSIDPQTGTLRSGGTGVPLEVAGPGYFQMVSGRNIDLGASTGVETIGNTFNAVLADQGASFSAWAGMVKTPDYDTFFRHYFVEKGRYDFRIGDLSEEESFAALNKLPEAYRRVIAQKILFSELRLASSAQLNAPLDNALASIAEGDGTVNIDTDVLKALGYATSDARARVTLPPDGLARANAIKSSGYQIGYQAIDLLFPGAAKKVDAGWKGNIALYSSKIHTLDGGDIGLVAPGGLVNAGLVTAVGGVEKPADQLGVIVQREGALDVLVKNDFLVNRARVMTLGGDDVTAWSSYGNIDAGRGSRGALAAPPPRVTFDKDGNPQVEFPPIVSGSGIRTVASGEKDAGDVFLAAPNGTVDAGEAGIAGRNVIIAAAAVVNAANIEVGGASFGVPTAAAPPVVVPGADGAAASATKSVQSQSEGDEQEQKKLAGGDKKDTGLTMLNVDVIGFGDCSVSDVRDGKAGCGA